MPTYTLNNVNYTYTVGTVQASVGTSGSATGNITLLSSFVVNDATYNVTSIGNSAFYNLASLTSVTIPDSVTSIGTSAFHYSGNLTSISISNLSSLTSIGANAFNRCAKLADFTIPNSVSSIGANAFEGCILFTSIVIPSSLTTIANSAFRGCSNLTSITIHTSVTSIGNNAFMDCTSITSISIPNSVTSIGNSAFQACTNLTSINIPNVTTLGTSIFNICPKLVNIVSNTQLLTNIIIPNNVGLSITIDYVGNIPASAFYNLNEMVNVTIGPNITSIGSLAFAYCRKLSSVNIHINSLLTSIGSQAFNTCLLLTSINIPSSVTSIESQAFSSCSSLTSINIPSSVTTIKYNTFYGCSAMTSCPIPSSVTSIEDWAFVNCTLLANITIPSTIISIGNNVFMGCANLTSVTLPSSLTTCGLNVFSQCVNLATVVCNSSAVGSTIIDKITLSALRNITFGYAGVITESRCDGLSTLVNVTIGPNITSIGQNAFNLCTSLKSCTNLSSITIIEPRVFRNCSAMTSCNIPSSVTSIGNDAFFNCALLESVIIPTSVTSIDYQAFQGCSSFPTLTISSSLTSISYNVFYGCSNVSTIVVDPNNTNYSSENNVLFNKNKTILILYPSKSPTSSYIIPNTVTNFEQGSFWDCTNLTSITIPASATGQIWDYTFFNCNNLLTVIFAGNIPGISSNNFTAIGDTAKYIKTPTLNTDPTTTANRLTLFSNSNFLSLTNFSVATKTFGNDPFTITPPTTNSTGAFTYTSSDTAIATVSGDIITIVGGGTATITATQASATIYPSGTISASFVVSKASPTLSFSIPAKTNGNAPFIITPPTSNSTGAFTYTSSNGSVATIAGSTITIRGSGVSVITATQATTTNYLTKTIAATFAVNTTTSTLTPTITNFSVPFKTVGNSAFTLTQPTSNSTGGFTYTSSNVSVATITNTSTVTIVGAGISTITATQASTTTYKSGETTALFQVGLAGQVMTTLSNFSVSAKTFGDASFNITPPTTNSNGAFTYTSSNIAVATVSGDIITIVGGGTATITATQASTSGYTSSAITASFVVSQGTPTITNFVVPTKIVGDASFNIIAPTSNSTGLFTYTSSDTSVATISGNVVTIIAVGSSTITAEQASTTNFVSGSITALFSVNQATTVITNFVVPAKAIGNAPFSLVAPTTNSNSLITYTSSDTSVATIEGNVVTIVGIGSSTITASQESTTNYTSATITSLLTVGLAPTITDFTVPEKIFGDASFNLVTPTTDSDGLITYTSSNTAVATISGDVVTIVGGGTSTITAEQAFTAIYGPGSITALLVVSKTTPTITNFSVDTKIFGDASFNLIAPTSNSTGLFTYTSSDTAVATIAGNVVTIVGGGTSTITAEQESTANYVSGSIPATLTVNQATPIITNFVVPAKVVENAPFSLVAPTTNSNGLFTYTSSDTSVATIEGNVVTIVGIGSSTITAEQASTSNFVSGTITGTLIVRLTPVITDFVVPEKTYGDATFTITPPTTDSDGLITYSSSNVAVATVSGDIITIVGAGSANITAVQSTTTNYASSSITAPLVVSKATTVLSNFSVPTKTFGNAAFAITPPTTNSNGAFTYTSSDTAVATIAGSTITIVGAGTSTITASQAMNTNYTAETIPVTLTVNQATPVITNFVVPSKVVESVPFSLVTPTTNSPGLFTYTSSDTSVATIEGNVVTIVGKGTSTITAEQASTTNFLSGTITSTLIVRFTPVITYFAVSEKTFGDVSFNLVPPTTDSDGTFTYTSSNTAVATIAGDVVTIVGAGSATITAVQALTDNYVSGTITAPFVVNKATTILTNFSVPEKVFGNVPFSIVAPTTNSNGILTYTSSDPTVATVAGSTITIIGAGSTTITANQATANNFLSGSIPTTFTVSQAPPIYYYFNGIQKVVEDVSFTIAPPSSNSSGLYTYASSDTSIATIEENVVTILKKGTIIITATQESTANYLSGSVTATFVILLRTVMSDFSVPGKTFGDAPFEIVAPTTNSNGAITYRSGNLSVATIVGNMITILRGGTTLITAVQALTSDYEAKEITSSLVVTRATTILSNFSVPAKVFGNASFAITPPTTNSDGAFTYTSSNTAVATVSGSTITIVAPGSAIITASQPNTTQYLANSIDTTLTVEQAPPTITNFSVPTKIVGNAAFAITPPTTNSNGAFTYTSSNTAVATVSGSTITIVGVGSATITANQASTTNYLAGTITANFQVNQITTTITGFSVPAKQFGNANFNITAPTTNSIGAFTYTSSNTAVATIDGDVVTVVGVGSSTITANQASTTNYTAGTITATFTVSKATPVLTNFSVSTKTFGDASFEITAPTTNSNGVLTYTSSNTAIATVAGNVITIVGAGTSTITASQATTTDYTSASVTATLTVNKATATLTNFVLPLKIIGNAPFTITPPTTNSNGIFSYTSSNTSVATVSGSVITILGIGTSTITANQSSTANYTAGTVTAVFQVNNVTPIITNFSVPTKTFGDAPFTLVTPTSNSTGAFSYTSSDTSVAIIVGNTITIVGGGTSTISAIQASTSSYVSGTITSLLTVNPATAVLTNFSVFAKTFGNVPFSLVTPTSNSTGAFTYTSSNTSVATILGDVITIVGAGSSTITATQASTASYTSGSITANFQVGQAIPTISFSVPTKTVIEAPYTIISPTSNSNGNFTYTSSNASVATIVGNVVTIVGLGSTTITAVQASTVNYTAGTITAVFQVIKATPTLSDFYMSNKTIGSSTFLVTPPTSDSDGNFTYISSDTSVATIAGSRVTIKGTGNTTITAVQATTAIYTSATISDVLEINLIPTVLANFSLPTKTYSDIPFRIQASSNSSGVINYTSSDLSVATIVGDIVTIVGPGSSTITASQENWNYYTSATISETLQVNQLTTVLTNFSVPLKTVGNTAFTLNAPSSNRVGAFTYTSSDTSVATIDENIVTIVGGGTSTISASQESNAYYTSETITATLTVNPGIPTLTNFSIPAKAFGDTSFTINSPISNSDGAFTYTSSNKLVATIVDDVITIVGTGSCTVVAVQASTTSYTVGTISTTLVVSKAVTTLANFSVPTKEFGNVPFTITPPTTNSNGVFTYTSSNLGVATIVKNVITIVGVGTSTITANQPSTANYTSETITATLTVSQGTPAITEFSISTKTVGNANFSLVSPKSNSNGAFTYTSSDLSVATIDGDVVTIIGSGSSNITATQESNANFLSGTIMALFIVNQITPVITNFSIPRKLLGNESFTIVPPTSDSNGTLSYTSSDTTVATIDGDVVTIVGGGNTTITALQSSTSSYASATINALFTVQPIQTVLTEFSVPTKIIGESNFTIDPPITNSNGAFTYTSYDTDIATIEGDVITIVGLGDTTIKAVQSSTANYTTDAITTIFQVKLIRTVLSNFVIPAKTVGDTAFTIAPPTTNSDGAFTYTSSNKLVATIVGDVVTIVGTGNVIITAFQESTPNSTPAKITASLVVNKALNEIDWFSVPEKAFGNVPFTITPPTTNSNGAFTYTSSNPEVATIVKNVITIVGVGTSTITANQANTINYTAGTITATLIVDQGTPVLTNFSVPTKTIGSPTFTIVPPTSQSSGAFTYTSSDTSIATIDGDVVTIIGTGTSIITALQESTTNYESATTTALFRVNQITTSLTNFAVPTKTFGDATFTIVEPNSNSDGDFTYISSNTAVATINNNVITIVGAGNTTITAEQASTESYTSSTVSALFEVNQVKTVLTNFSIPAKIIGEGEFSLVIPTTNSNGQFTYTSSNPEVATVESDVITIVGLGTSRITAVQASTTNYTSDSISALFEVNLITTSLTDFSIPSKTAGDTSFSLVPPTTNSTGVFTYTSSNKLVATIVDDIVTIVGVGTTTITAVQASTANSISGTISTPLVVNKRTPTISDFIIPQKSFGNPAFKLTPPTTNGVGAFTYTSSDLDVATINKDIVQIIGVGSSTITAVQESTANFISGSITALFQVNLGSSVLTNFVVPTKTFGNATFTLVPPSTNHDSEITYTSSNPDVATIDDDVVTIVGAGNSVITATQASTDVYLSSTITATFTVNRATTVLTNFSLPTKAVGDATFSITNPTTNSNGDFTYTSSNTAVATIAGNVVTIVGGGISTITAVQDSTTNYTSATITASFQVSALTTVLSNFTMPTKVVGNASFAIVPPTTESNGSFTYTSSNVAVATIAGNMVTIIGAGTSTITASQASTSNYTSATTTTSFVVNKGTPTITFSMPIKEIGMPDFTITDPTSLSTGAFTYTSSDIKVATVFKNIVSIKTIGNTIITASQAMTSNYINGTITTTFVVNQMSPTLSTVFTVPATKTVGDATFKLVAPKSNSISPFTFTSSNIAVVRIVKDVVTIVGTGTAIITATQAATKSYGPKTVTAPIQVNPKTTVLTNFLIPSKISGNAPFIIGNPTTNSNGTFTYTSSNPAVATIAGNMVTIIGVGSSTITAEQASSANFTSATISTTLVVTLPFPQVGTLQITNKSLTNPAFTIVDPTKPVDNTGTWTYTSSDTTKATLSGNTVTLLQPGIVTVNATLSSDSLYNSVLLMTQFSISDQGVAPGSFVFIRSSEVAVAIPTTIIPSLNMVLPTTISTPANIAKFNPTLGTATEKERNQNMIVNTLFNMFPLASSISIPTTLLYVPLAFNKSKLKTIRLVRPTETTVVSPLVINTVASDSAIAFLTSIVNYGNSVRLNGVGTFAGNFLIISRGDDNKYMVTKTTKANVTTSAIGTNGDIITFAGITAMIGYI